jgi:holo-ACP synthase
MMAISTDQASKPVTIEQMMAARERRAARQISALTLFSLPVVSIAAVMPGPIKDNGQSRTIIHAATQSLSRLFSERKWPVCLFEPVAGPTGPEALYVVDADALAIKEALIGLEETHPLGRLWDLDVISPQQGLLSRRALGHPPRKCLLCDAEAHACARSQRHSLDQLLRIIEHSVDAYRHQPYP